MTKYRLKTKKGPKSQPTSTNIYRSTCLIFILAIILPISTGCLKKTQADSNTTDTQPTQSEPKKNLNSPQILEPNKSTPFEPNKIVPPAEKTPLPPAFFDQYTNILTKYVKPDGTISYRKLKARKRRINDLLSKLRDIDPKNYENWTENEKIAFWINTYNIKLIRNILDNYPIKTSRMYLILWPPTSIRHISPSNLIGTKKWRDYKFIVMNEEFTLPVIEQRFFRKNFADPRIIFAISQASLDSPHLRTEPYNGEKLDEQLTDQIKKFLKNPRAFKIDRRNKRLYLSAIFQASWYGKDFLKKYAIDKKFKDHNPTERAVLNFLTNYLTKSDIEFLEVENYSIKYIGYDWRLNE